MRPISYARLAAAASRGECDESSRSGFGSASKCSVSFWKLTCERHSPISAMGRRGSWATSAGSLLADIAQGFVLHGSRKPRQQRRHWADGQGSRRCMRVRGALIGR